MKLQTELNRIQKELKAPKSQVNDFGKYKYRNAEDILNAYKKVAEDTVLVISDDIVQVGERYYVKAIASLSLETENVTATAFAREPEEQRGMSSAQITGATSSYARKYALNALFAIDDTKDADFAENKTEINTDKIKEELATIEKIGRASCRERV